MGIERREEEVAVEQGAKPAHKVHLVYEQGEAEIGAVGAVGVITGKIVDAYVRYGGQKVTQVPEGAKFEVVVVYDYENPGFVLRPGEAWIMAFTVMSTDGSVYGAEYANMIRASGSGVVQPIDLWKPMPDHTIYLRVKLWGNQSLLQGQTPPQSDW